MLFVGLNKTLSIKYRLLIIQYNLILADFIFKDSISKKRGGRHILRFQMDMKFERQNSTQNNVLVKKKSIRDWNRKSM